MRSSTQLAVGAIVALLVACSDRTEERRADLPQVSADAMESDADNSRRNERDRSGATLTPLDQGGSEADLGVTQLVRQRIVAEDGFSVDAKNVKVITQDGVVTLRGPVETAEEKARIEAITASADGVRRVDNQLEVENDR